MGDVTGYFVELTEEEIKIVEGKEVQNKKRS